MAADLALGSAVFLSGAAGLIFQIVWLYRGGLVLGNSLWAVTLVLSSFMAGLALGNAGVGAIAPRIRRLLPAYALLECTVALSGIAASTLLPHLTTILVPVTERLSEGAWTVSLVRLAGAFALLVVPASAMGATLPVLVGAVSRQRRRSYGVVLGRLYGWNTLGAVVGVVGAEVLLIEWLGVTRTAWVAGACNFCAAGLALWSAGRAVSVEAEAPPDTRRPFVVRRPLVIGLLLACSGLAGMTVLALEVIWFRFLTLYVLSTTLATSLMLATVLAGIAAGGLLGGWWIGRRPDAARQVPLIALLSGCAVIASYADFGWLTTGTQIAEWHRLLWMAVVLTLPTATASGVIFTLLGTALERDVEHEARTTAWLTLGNTLGALAGAPVATFLLLPAIGMEGAFFLLASAWALIAAISLVALRPLPRSSRWPLSATAAALLLALALFPFGAMKTRYFARAAAAYSGDGSHIVATHEGESETIFLMRQDWLGSPVYHRLVTNGFSMTGTAVPGLRYMRYFAYWPMFVHEGPIRRGLVICYGVGVTASAILEIPSIESLDVVEISPDVVAMSDLIYPPDRHPLRDPRSRLHLEDGRFFLETTSERFDLITGEPPPPRTPGASNIYTREYFELVRSRLSDGGMATYWLPVGRPNPGTDVDTIIKAFCEVFDDCSLWNATPFDLMLAGSRQATGPVSVEHFSRAWQTPGLQASLREIGFERPEQIGATFLGDADDLRAFTAKTPPLTDDFPQRLRQPADRATLSDSRFGTDARVRAHYDHLMDPARAAQAFASSPLIRRLWPEPLIEATVPYFETERLVNQVLWDGSHPLAHVEDWHDVLTTTTLRTLPLWLLGSDEVRQQIAEASESDETGAREYARGLRSLTGRDYERAAAFFLRAEHLGLGGTTIPMLAYSLCMSGRVPDARHLAQTAEPTTPDEQHFWQWLSDACGA
jgi:predicted membrane-bound spermidine synthase